ncbi:MAG: ATPase domain-containing protein [Candidatus Heimdallarchaeaceae archaeon]
MADDKISDVSSEEILKSVELNIEETPAEPVIEVAKPIVKKETMKFDDKATADLYEEFTSFLEDKVDMIPDTGIKNVIPTGIELLDAILGGGLAIGSLDIIVGQPGSGKSMLAIQVLAQAQKMYEGKLIGAFLDSEEATTTIRLSNLGVRFPKIKPYPDITVEKVFKFLEGLCLFKEKKKIIDIPSVVIWDSIANTLSEKEREAEDVNQVIGYKARMLSILIPKYVARCSQYNIAFIAVNQLRDVLNIGQFSAPKDLKFMSASKDMPGGTVLKYNAFHLLEMKLKSALKPEMYGFDGVIVKVKCVKNKLFSPNIEIEIVGSFTTGFSNFWTNYNFLAATKRLNTGAWNSLVTLPEKKFRTKDAESLYLSDDNFKEKYDESVKEAIKTEIIEKYNPDID